MNYSISDAVKILERTPVLLNTLLRNLPEEWLMSNEGTDTWSPYDVVGHLIHGEKTDWIERLEITLTGRNNGKFTSFDRFAQFEESKGKSMNDLLDEFLEIRNNNIIILISKNILEVDFNKTALHPALGKVTLKNLLSTWVAHDLDHIAQIARVMAKQYKSEVGPWQQYMRVMN